MFDSSSFAKKVSMSMATFNVCAIRKTSISGYRLGFPSLKLKTYEIHSKLPMLGLGRCLSACVSSLSFLSKCAFLKYAG